MITFWMVFLSMHLRISWKHFSRLSSLIAEFSGSFNKDSRNSTDNACIDVNRYLFCWKIATHVCHWYLKGDQCVKTKEQKSVTLWKIQHFLFQNGRYFLYFTNKLGSSTLSKCVIRMQCFFEICVTILYSLSSSSRSCVLLFCCLKRCAVFYWHRCMLSYTKYKKIIAD